ncbi:MAG: hypothetical protein AB1664_18380 [Thermodesulfobacteriota bacterium]
MTKKDKEVIKEVIGFILVIIIVVLDMVAYEMLKDTAILGVIMVVGGVYAMPILTVGCIQCLVKKKWGGALVCAAFVGLFAWGLWFALSDAPWHQLPEDIDMVLNFFKTL